MTRNSSRIFYLMGASGSGKDSLLRECREQLGAADRCFVAHRYITRAPELAGENHIWLTEAEFSQREACGAFAMHWQANGLRYGIGCEVDLWLEQGNSVLVNGSRSFLPLAQMQYADRLVPLMVRVDTDLLLQRLRSRGRESEPQILARVERARQFQQGMSDGVAVIDNNGSLAEGVGQLLKVLRSFNGVAEGR
mgnify:CR=1 FL=1|jgi:ribose 1,5-bisphosphokinase